VFSKLKILTERPNVDLFNRNHLDKQQQDDFLIAAILEFKIIHQDEKVCLITADTGPKLKAKSLDIKVYKPSDSLLLPDEEDDNEKKLREVTQNLNNLKNRQPKVDLYFSDKQKTLEVQKPKEFKPSKDIVNKHVNKIEHEYHYMSLSHITETLTPQEVLFINQNNFLGVSQQQIIEYNNRLDDFYRNQKEYIQNKYNYELTKQLSFELKFLLYNDGTLPAEDIDIWIYLPDGFEAFSKKQYPKGPVEPEPPYKPRGIFDLVQTRNNLSLSKNPISSYRKITTEIESSPSIKKTNSYEIEHKIDNLKHNQSKEVGIFIIQHKSTEERKNFIIDYKLFIANVSKPIEGKLLVKFL
ncbi:MAG: hypothetical protein EOP42_09045, partial [Sphingobacteriaceae bacterium]